MRNSSRGKPSKTRAENGNCPRPITTSASAHVASSSSSVAPRPCATAAPAAVRRSRAVGSGPSSKTPMFTTRRRPSFISVVSSGSWGTRGNIVEPRPAPQGPGVRAPTATRTLARRMIGVAPSTRCIRSGAGASRAIQRGPAGRSEMARTRHLHTSHWGAFEAEVDGGAVVAVHPYRDDPDPSPLLDNIPASLRHRARIAQPMVRAGWLDRGPGPDQRRGAEPFVPVSWPTAIDLLTRELRRVYGAHGGEAVYGGSYGWASAGRFHHAQSQLHRFLNCLGGYVRGEHSYSNGALTVI